MGSTRPGAGWVAFTLPARCRLQDYPHRTLWRRSPRPCELGWMAGRGSCQEPAQVGLAKGLGSWPVACGRRLTKQVAELQSRLDLIFDQLG